jgi:hypothetical protein
MSSRIGRRAFLASLLASSGGFLCGCLSTEGDSSSPTRSQSPDETISSSPSSQTASETTTRQDDRTDSGGLAVNNGTAAPREVSITVVEAPESSPSYEDPGTLTAETPVDTTDPLFRRDVAVEADGYKGFSDVFPKPDGPVTYHVFAELNSGESSTYGFENFPGSGFGYVSVFISSAEELEIVHAVA